MGKKEYNYEYEEGRIVRSAEADITLSGDVLSVIVEYYLKNLQKKYYSQIKKLKKKKNSKNLERKMQSKKNTAIIIKIYYCGIHLNITLPVSNLLLSFVLNIIFW